MAKYVMRIEAVEEFAGSAAATAATGRIAATSGTQGSEARAAEIPANLPCCGRPSPATACGGADSTKPAIIIAQVGASGTAGDAARASLSEDAAPGVRE